MWPRRRPAHTPDAAPPPKANPVRIAVLEHELLGIEPEPGTAAALAIALCRTAVCLTHDPIDTTCLSDPRRNGVCRGCSRPMVEGDDGKWTTV
jgi:hypothetical protein